MKVKDLNGSVLEGIERGQNNALIVTDKTAYNKYIIEVERAKRLKRLEDDMVDVKNTLSEIIKILKQDR